jgi:hypothetical protein
MKRGFVVRSLVALLFVIGLAASIYGVTPSSATASSVENAVSVSNAFSIGQSYGGGIIFWIDATGQHGLIAPTSDTSYLPIWWGDRYYLLAGATGTAVGTGSINTQKIVAVQGEKYNYAALVCVNYRGGGYADWFLPAKDELYQLYQQKSVVGGFIRGGYWSSSEYATQFDHTLAWQKYFYNDNATLTHKDRVDGVRCVRAF